jgi:ketosteroid isomerase-like protein
MRTTGVFLAVLLVLGTSGCAQPVDIEAERAALLQADAAWAQAASAKDLDGTISFLADGASTFPPNATMVTGEVALRELWAEEFATPGFAVSWQASTAEVSAGGDLGYTVGTYEGTMNDPEGNPVTDRGKYVTVWKKQPDGSWKAVADIWNSDLPVSPASE